MYREEPVRVLVTAPLGVGGITNMMINIQSHMDRTKVNFDYLVFHDRKEPQEDTVIGMGSRKLTASVDGIKMKPLRRLLRLGKIRKVCKENHIQIMHYNADNPADLMNIIAAKMGGVKYVTIHSHSAGFGTAGRGIRMISKLSKPFIPFVCDKFYGCSNLAARFLFPQTIIASGNYEILPNAIDLEKYDFNWKTREEIRERMGIQDKFVVGHAGRFSDEKNHAFLLDIFKMVYEQDSRTVLLLFGVGELMEPMKKKAVQLGISSAVIFYGASNEMYKMWQAMDVFVMPSFYEGMPVTGIEAQTSGLPCIFSDTITKEVGITENAEFLSLKESPELWAERILRCRGRQRKSCKSALLKAGYDIRQTADIVERLYLDVHEKLSQ